MLMRVYTAEEFMTSSKMIHIFKETADCTVKSEDSHTHEFIEIVYILSGEMTHVINDTSYSVRRGDILFMSYGCTHSFFSDSGFSYMNILFSPDIIGEKLITPQNAFSVLSLSAFNEMCGESDFGKISFIGKERDEAENIIFSMLREYKDKLTSWEIVIGNYLTTLMIKMLRKTTAGIPTSDIDGMWQSLFEYIDRNIGTKLTLSSLAKKCFYNPSYFSRVFKEKFGMTLIEYITRKRLEHAVDLLENTELSLQKISEQVGFSDKNSLYHAFSKYLGASPGDYRKKRS